MKKIISTLILAGMFLISCLNGYTQTRTLHAGDTLWLRLAVYRGGLQWQESSDSITWNDIPGAYYQPYVVVFNTPKYYRGK